MKIKKTMSSPTLSTIMIFSFLFFTIIDAKAQSCSDEFAKLIEQKNITECKILRTLRAEFGWKVYNSTNLTTTVEILFGAYLESSDGEGWIAWGVNPGKRAEMIGTKALIGVINHDSSLIVKTYDVTKETKRGCALIPMRDIGFNVSNMLMQNVGSNFYTIYAKLVLPSDVYNITRLNHVWQIGFEISNGKPLNHPTTLHNVDSTETIDLTSTSGRSTGQSRSFLRSVHGVLNIIGWGTMLPIGVIIPRYFRVFPFKDLFNKDKLWFQLHVGCQTAGFLIGTAGWIIGLVLGHSSRYYIFHTHRTFGILIFTFSTIQMLAFRLKPKKTDDYRKYWNMYHHFLGYGLLTIIFINIFKGINILNGGHKWKRSYIGILTCLGTIAFGLEITTWVKFLRTWAKKDKEEREKNNAMQSNKDKSDNACNQKQKE